MKKWVLGLHHCDLDLWPKVTKLNRVWASAGSNHLAKIASNWCIHRAGTLFTRSAGQPDTHTHTDRHTDKLQWKFNPSTILWRFKNNTQTNKTQENKCFLSHKINFDSWASPITRHMFHVRTMIYNSGENECFSIVWCQFIDSKRL